MAEMDIFEIIERTLIDGKKGALVTIIRKIGAAPRESGAKMFVEENGTSHGTVGGGSAEAEAQNEALKVIASGKPAYLHFRMNAKEVADEGMICGGNIDLFVEPVLPDQMDVYGGINHCRKRGRKAVMITVPADDGITKALVDVYGKTWGSDVPDEVMESSLQYLKEKGPVVVDKIIYEPIQGAPNLFIFGAGHVSQFVSKMAKMVDFSVTVVDDRIEFANRERFPEADEIEVGKFENVFKKLNFSGDVYIVIVTRGHSYDALVLEESMKIKTRYVGMIGSSRKVAMVLRNLREKGFPEENIAKVFTPIGIKIHSETPAEIAVSIVAQLIDVRGKN